MINPAKAFLSRGDRGTIICGSSATKAMKQKCIQKIVNYPSREEAIR